jgi:hypothetical protein
LFTAKRYEILEKGDLVFVPEQQAVNDKFWNKALIVLERTSVGYGAYTYKCFVVEQNKTMIFREHQILLGSDD